MNPIKHLWERDGKNDLRVSKTIRDLVNYCNNHQQQSIRTLEFQSRAQARIESLMRVVGQLADSILMVHNSQRRFADRILNERAQDTEAKLKISVEVSRVGDEVAKLTRELSSLQEHVSNAKSGRRS
jgi:phage shock protein A